MFRVISRYFSTELKTRKSLKPINKILIANRGEIACRVVRTARRLGIQTVAVYSDADKKSLHTEMADEAYNIGPPPSQESYLRGDKIIQIAKNTGCQAIHPGYGFLSESVEFSELCENQGVIFMGPPASAIRDMGIKNISKALMSKAGVPVINGYHGEDQSDEILIKEADNIGYPLMIKAVRGGGGKGMRIADKKENFIDALNSARNESQKSFGDKSVLLERFVRSPRHVEVQIFGDLYGNVVYLFERDCSVQRRHQKIIEEAPAPGLSENLRKEIGEAAVRAAKAVGYVGAGTVEFILDKDDFSFNFMEMNTRLQVEHPITEMITGTDLVEWQIRIASGEKLPLNQDEIRCNGHAFEARIYAENPREGFLPGAGNLNHLSTPLSNENVRIETGVRQGDDVSIHYDPMIAKLVVWGQNRTEALNSLIARLRDYHITGLETNVNFLITLASHPDFYQANVHTGFIDQHYESLFPAIKIHENSLCEACIALLLNELNAAQRNSLSNEDPFIIANGLRLNHDLLREFTFKSDEKTYNVLLKQSNNKLYIKVNSHDWKEVEIISYLQNDRFNIRYNLDGAIKSYSAVIDSESVALFNENGKVQLEFVQPNFLKSHLDTAGHKGSIVSPMPGVLEKVIVKSGDKVKKGDPLAVIIAMKMEHILRAHNDAIVKTVSGKQGDYVAKGATIITFVNEELNEK